MEAEPKEMKTLQRSFEIKEVKPSGWFAGYGSTFGNVDEGGDVCDAACFDRTLKEHDKTGTVPAMLFSHNPNEPIGEWQQVRTDKKGLYMEGQLALGKGIPKAEQAYLMLSSRTQKGLSIGYLTRKANYDEKTGVRTLMDVDLLEVSPTQFPMNTRAKITNVKSLLSGKSIITVRDAEDILRDAGFSASESKHFLSCLKSGWNAERDADAQLIQAVKNLQTIFKG